MAPRRTLPPTTRPSAAREWLLFGAAALLPTLGLGALGLRALRNEEAAIRREAAAEVTSSAERAAGAVNEEVAAAKDALARATFEDVAGRDPTPKAWLEVASTLAPRAGAAVVVSPSGSLAEPSERATPPAPHGEEPCKSLVETLATASVGARSDAKQRIIASCPEAKSELGRWLWPTFVLEALAAKGDDALAERLAAWLRAHAGSMKASEREATEAEISTLRGLGPDASRALTEALAGAMGRVESLARAVHGDAAVKASRGAHGEVVTFRGSGALGALRPLSNGWLVGFVVTPETLAETIAATPERYGRSPDATLEVVRRSDDAARGEDARPTSAADAIVAFAWLTDGLGLRASLTRPEALLARTSRSEAWLSAIAVLGGLCAIALAASSFLRLRAARRTSELRTSFVAAVSHELRTPIASVRMLAELLDEGRVDEDERGEVYEALAKEARRLGETVDRLLGFSRMAADKVVLERAVTRLADPVSRAVDRFRERSPGLDVAVKLDAAVRADVDVAQVELIVDNLLGNAKKYAPKGTPYEVVVERVGDEARLSISDHGPGIARRDHRRIFEAFERVDDRLSKATEGSGIGLSLVAHAARAHGGAAWVESELGAGARFVVSFPLVTTTRGDGGDDDVDAAARGAGERDRRSGDDEGERGDA